MLAGERMAHGLQAFPGLSRKPPRGARQISGALYMSCTGRGGPHFGAPSAELQLLKHALGDVPLVGFFAGGEIGHRHLYGYGQFYRFTFCYTGPLYTGIPFRYFRYTLPPCRPPRSRRTHLLFLRLCLCFLPFLLLCILPSA